MNLKINQIISHTDGSKRKVLEVGVNTVLVSYEDNFDKIGYITTEKDLITIGWIIPIQLWEPEMNEDYFAIDDDGTVLTATWTDHPIDEGRQNFLGVYKDRKLAEKALEEIKIKLGK